MSDSSHRLLWPRNKLSALYVQYLDQEQQERCCAQRTHCPPCSRNTKVHNHNMIKLQTAQHVNAHTNCRAQTQKQTVKTLDSRLLHCGKSACMAATQSLTSGFPTIALATANNSRATLYTYMPAVRGKPTTCSQEDNIC